MENATGGPTDEQSPRGDYLYGQRHRLNSEIRYRIDHSGLFMQDIARDLHVVPSNLSRMINGQRAWRYLDMRGVLEKIGTPPEDCQRLLDELVRINSTKALVAPYTEILGEQDRVTLEALAHCPLVHIQPGWLLPYPIRTISYQRRLDDMMQRTGRQLALGINLLTTIWQSMIDQDSTVKMLLARAAWTAAGVNEQVRQPISAGGRMGRDWTLRLVRDEDILHPAMLNPFMVLCWPDEPLQNLYVAINSDQTHTLHRRPELIEEHLAQFEDQWDRTRPERVRA